MRKSPTFVHSTQLSMHQSLPGHGDTYNKGVGAETGGLRRREQKEMAYVRVGECRKSYWVTLVVKLG